MKSGEAVLTLEDPPLGDSGELVPTGMVTVNTMGSPEAVGGTVKVTTLEGPTGEEEVPLPGTVTVLVLVMPWPLLNLVGTATVTTVEAPSPRGSVSMMTPDVTGDGPACTVNVFS